MQFLRGTCLPIRACSSIIAVIFLMNVCRDVAVRWDDKWCICFIAASEYFATFGTIAYNSKTKCNLEELSQYRDQFMKTSPNIDVILNKKC